MGQNQSEALIDNLNKLQNTFYIKTQKSHLSKYPCFKGFLRISSDFDSHSKGQKIPHDKKTSYFIKLVSYNTEQEKRCFDRMQILLKMFNNYPEIIKQEKIVNITLSQSQYILVASKFYQSTDLFEYLWHSIVFIDEDLIRNITFQCIKILKLLKSHQILHNNIKFENFIVKTEYPFKIGLTDFKYAIKLEKGEKSKSLCGTSLYKAPEVLQRKPHDFASDMWSLGANIYLALFKKYPFEIEADDDEFTILNKIKNNVLVNKNMIASNDAWKCINAMLAINPNQRISPEEALMLPWFDKFMKRPEKFVGNIIKDA